MSLRRMIEQLPKGGAILASARLRRQIVKSLNVALNDSNMSQSELARALGKSRSAVSQVLTGDGNLKIETVAEYLYEMGAEMKVSVHFPSANREVSLDNYLSVIKWVKTTSSGNSIHVVHSPDRNSGPSFWPTQSWASVTHGVSQDAEVA